MSINLFSSCTAIPWDNVDEEFISVPRKWDASSVGNFMIWIGPTSSIFDFTTYIFMYFVFCPMFVSDGVLFNDLANHFSGAELAVHQHHLHYLHLLESLYLQLFRSQRLEQNLDLWHYQGHILHT